MKRRLVDSARGWVFAISLGATSCSAPVKDAGPVRAPSADVPRANGGETAITAADTSEGTSGAGAATPGSTIQPAPLASPEECATRERMVDNEVMNAYFVMNPGGAYQSAFDESARALERCPGSEPIWYTFARMAELGFHHFPMQVAGSHVASLQEASALALSHLPRSARIAVIDARVHGDVERARSALALDPGYAPGRVALAEALFNDEKLDEALPLSSAPSVPGAASLRALILVARGKPGDAKQAERLARKELTANWEAAEPYQMKSVRCAAQEALAVSLHAQKSRKAKEELARAVDCGSHRARELLDEMP